MLQKCLSEDNFDDKNLEEFVHEKSLDHSKAYTNGDQYSDELFGDLTPEERRHSLETKVIEGLLVSHVRILNFRSSICNKKLIYRMKFVMKLSLNLMIIISPTNMHKKLSKRNWTIPMRNFKHSVSSLTRISSVKMSSCLSDALTLFYCSGDDPSLDIFRNHVLSVLGLKKCHLRMKENG